MTRNAPASLSEVLKDQLYVGNLSAALSVEQRKKHGITHILSVCPEYPTTGATQDHLNISIEDSEYADLLIHLPETCRFIDDALRKGGRVLVHCVMGISRSPAVVAAYLMKTRGYLAPEAITFVRQRRPQVHLNYGFAVQLDTFRKCGFAPSLANPIYRSWKRRNEQDVTAFLNHLVDTVSIIPDKLFLSSEFPSDPQQTWSLLMDLGITHLLSISPTEIATTTTAGAVTHHHHVNVDSRAPDALLSTLPDICAYVDGAIKRGGRVLVHSMVESRACAAVCAYLMSIRQYTATEAFGVINEALPLFNPTRNFIRTLEVFEECGYAPGPNLSSSARSSAKSENFSCELESSKESGMIYDDTRRDFGLGFSENFGNVGANVNMNKRSSKIAPSQHAPISVR
ncbi:Dual specificity protein phosphatase 22-A [Psilocybe cubensis]|uniref:Dual specificity protein phosphatase 22-A n=2 Tax=Psilocybe cubensis TaxID=181762 RepID=A0ACB8H2D8_PSICU|nr:Dual specificity protein phosphatase 22-A [Psilocybe cubensis]KAH9482170.1 Dual specificity protein phosphatase 22-A [Psilocybe cubensis]